MSENGDHDEEEEVGHSSDDFFDHDPCKQEKIEMRKAVKPPSDWLKMLCREWAAENPVLVETTDAKFLDYKPYLKGLLTSQLLCRLSIPQSKVVLDETAPTVSDFWAVLGISDAFDRAYIVAQIERFCSLYCIRAVTLEDDPSDQLFGADVSDPATIAAAASMGVSSSGILSLPAYMDPGATAAAAAAAFAATDDASKLSKKQTNAVHRARNAAANAEQALVIERRQNYRREQRRIAQERKEQKHREREEIATRKAAERAEREADREDRRRRKVEIRMEREKFAQEQKEAALKRAAELVSSNRVPIEITRGAAAAKAAQIVIQAGLTQQQIVLPPPPLSKKRSAVVVSTARDLNQIVSHSKNLWAKYNAVAREHNQKVNWITVARELGINVKVREKYARMHARAEQRGFDWHLNGHWKIKDHPEVFLEPTHDEQRAKMPPPPPDSSRTVLIDGTKEVADASVSPPMDNVETTEQLTEFVSDPTIGSYSETDDSIRVEI